MNCSMPIMALCWPATPSEVKFAADSLLEGDGFELPVPRELGLRRGRRLALYLGSLTLRRSGPDWNATKRRRDSERRASTAAERGIEKTEELRRLKNARNRKMVWGRRRGNGTIVAV